MKACFALVEGSDPCDAQAIWIRRLLPDLKEFGLEPELLLYTTVEPERNPTVRFFHDLGITTHVTRNQGSSVNFVRWYLDVLRRTKPDVFVPQHVIWALYAARWVRGAGIPTVAVLHSDDEPCRAIHRNFGVAGDVWTVSALVAVSGEIGRWAAASPNVGPRVEVIPCGVPLAEPVRPSPGRPFRIGYLGRMIQHQKRVLDVARAFCEVARAIPGVEVYLWGDGSEREQVLRILEEEGRGLPVHCPGALPHADAQEALRSCDAMVLLSDWEGTPTVFMEAMASGVVPISRRIGGGTEELIEHGVSGLLLDGHPEALVDAVRSLKDDRAYWEKLSRGARARIESGFSSKQCATQWASLVNALVENSRPSEIRIPSRLHLPPPDPALASERRFPTGLNGAAGLMWRAKQVLEDLGSKWT